MRRVIGNVVQTVKENPWIFGGAMFFACVGVAAALDQQDVIDMMSTEEGLAALTGSFKKSMEEAIENLSETEVCRELYSYINTCNLFTQDFVTVDGVAEVSSCATGEVMGQASNPAAFACNAAKIMKSLLPEDTAERCADMAKTMGF